MGTEPLIDHLIQQLDADPGWAFRAYRRLLDSLSPDVRERLRPTDEKAKPYVAVFGKTQVGKTSLLLELMGIEPKHLDAVSKVLRGKQDTGRSATATAMEYCRSESNRWGLHRQPDMLWYESDDAMQDALAQLRRDMESGQLQLNSPCVVHIPRYFFAKAQETVSTRVLDLPGDNPANDVEQRHVEHMARTYLPFADLILLVGRADDLNFLQPGVITLPGIEDWQSMPRRFRVVTTYSYSAKSVRDLIRQDPQFDAAKRRKRLIEQIERFGGLSNAAKDKNLYFPLEFGTSWHGVQKNDPELFERMAPIIDELRKELLLQIEVCTSRVGRIRNTLDTHLNIRSLHERKRLALENVIGKLIDKESELLEEMSVWRNAIRRATRNIRKAIAELKNPSVAHGCQLLQEAVDSLLQQAIPPSDDGKHKDRTVLQGMILRSYAELTKIRLEPEPDVTALGFWVAVRGRLVVPEPSVTGEMVYDAFAEIRQQLDSYFLDRYIFKDNYQKDKAAVISAYRVALTAVLQLWLSSWKDALKATRLDKEKTLKQLKLQLRSLLEQRGQTIKLLVANRADLSRHRQALINLDITMREDLERCQQYLRLLDEEYIIQLQQALDQIAGTANDVDALSIALGSMALVQQRTSLLEMSKTRLSH
ncbi:hypothetical protein [Kerstersia gyiorum]|uniref:hypothetical protein n=1 Tax=Kerstersia gyiorum TaxID=206506 RepID=UPI003B42D56A